MTDRPILFSAPMVRALLAGTKTQTRRIARLPEPSAPILDFVKVGTETATGRSVYEMKDKRGAAATIRAGKHCLDYHFTPPIAVGDRLWVRENFQPDPPANHDAWDDHTCSFVEWSGCGSKISDVPPALMNSGECVFAADEKWNGFCISWRPSIHMPRWASRLTLIVSDVRVERLQAISEADALSEGVEIASQSSHLARVNYYKNYDPNSFFRSTASAQESFRSLWDSINGAGAWGENPWVVAYTFEVIAGNIDQVGRAA